MPRDGGLPNCSGRPPRETGAPKSSLSRSFTMDYRLKRSRGIGVLNEYGSVGRFSPCDTH